jgi:CysZ protein
MALHSITSPLYLLKGIRLIMQPGIRRYVIIPLLINFIIFTLFIAFGIDQFNQLIDSYAPALPQWLQWIEWLLWPLIISCFIAAGFFISLMLASLIAAPFNGFLAEAIERKLRPHNPVTDDSMLAALKTIGPALLSEVRKLGYFIVRAIPLLLLFIIPGLNLFAPILWLLFSAWMLALEYLEYPMSANGLLFTEIRRQLSQHRLTTLGFGAGILLLTIIPVINFFIMPIAVAGATALYVERIEKKD